MKIILFTFFLFTAGLCFAQDATEIIRKAEEKFQGETSSQSEMTMKIIRPTYERTIQFKNWTKGRALSLTLVTYPAREKGQAFLKVENDMWNWNPQINRMIKLPPSMMSQGWMGSDYSNDDILKESSIIKDYRHILKGSEQAGDFDCFRIELIPHDNAAVVWGKIIKWITKEHFLQMKSEYYDEDNYLIKTEYSYDIKMMDDREIPTRIVIQPAEENENQTIVIIKSLKFNFPIPDNFFSQQNMKSVR